LVVPVFAAEQAMQVPAQALSQQNPSTQLPSRHSLAAEHVAPVAFLPMQEPPEQMLPVKQSPSTVQVVLQAEVDAQTKPPAHEVALAGTHEPPLQVPLGT
jgi:hypothetical protein